MAISLRIGIAEDLLGRILELERITTSWEGHWEFRPQNNTRRIQRKEYRTGEQLNGTYGARSRK